MIKVKNISMIKDIFLKKYPLRKEDNTPTILEFVQRLLDDDKISSSCKKTFIKEWLKEVTQRLGLSLPINYTKIHAKKTIQESYLLIEMQKNPQIEGQFFLNSQILLKYPVVESQDTYKLEPLDINLDSIVECFFEELTYRISELIGQARCKLIRNHGYYEDITTVELFVPLGYLGHRFDLEPIPVTIGEDTEFKPIASEYNFTLRCSDRYSLGLSGDWGRWLTQFHTMWKHLQEFLIQNPTKTKINSKCVFFKYKRTKL